MDHMDAAATMDTAPKSGAVGAMTTAGSSQQTLGANGNTATAIAALPTAEAQPYVLVLCGVVGSGKSTLAQALELHMPERFVRCNQDVLKSRQRVQSAARRALAAGKVAIIDRVNGDAQQRSTWVELAETFVLSPVAPSDVQHESLGDATAVGSAASPPLIDVYALEFATPIETCQARLEVRTGHETLHTPEKALDILQRFARVYAPPQHSEGIVKIAKVWPSDFATALPTRSELQAVIGRLESAPRIVAPRQRIAQPSGGSRGGRPYRGRGRGAVSGRGWHGNGRGGYPTNDRPSGSVTTDSWRQSQLPPDARR